MARLLRGKPVAEALTAQLSSRVGVLAKRGIVPMLAVVRVGERADDLSYERGIEKRCSACGIGLRKFPLPQSCTQDELLSTVESINADEAVHGCLLLRPLPATLDEASACAALDFSKDVDGITDASLLGVFAGRPQGFPPCTAEAVMELLRFYDYGLEGANVTVLGRSMVVGRPVACLLQAAHATVTLCHTRTRDLAAHCACADIVVVATGHIGSFGEACAHAGQTVVDVGVNWDEGAGRLVGDVDFDVVEPRVAAITPVPGGIGSVTVACLAKHVVEAAERTMA